MGFKDCGEIAPKLRADAARVRVRVRVREVGGMPIVRAAWCRGERAIRDSAQDASHRKDRRAVRSPMRTDLVCSRPL
jgi:hypothetical protein